MGCDSNSVIATSNVDAPMKLWGLPLESGVLHSSSDSIAFSFDKNEIDKFRLWNGCYSLFGKDLPGNFFPKGAHFDTVQSSSGDTLLMSYPNAVASLRYVELDHRCVDTTSIATLMLKAGGFENKTYSNSDSIHFKFSYSIRPEATPHDFDLVLIGQPDSSYSITYSFTHSISGLVGEFDTTISVSDIPYAFKSNNNKFFEYGISYTKSDNVSNWVTISKKIEMSSIFD
jgi:hypothetical protein